MESNKIIKSFTLKVYQGKSITEKPHFSKRGQGNDWVNYTRLRFPGFDETISLSLEDVWRRAINHNLERYQKTIEGYETIVKFGQTKQLVEVFTAVVELEYM